MKRGIAGGDKVGSFAVNNEYVDVGLTWSADELDSGAGAIADFVSDFDLPGADLPDIELPSISCCSNPSVD